MDKADIHQKMVSGVLAAFAADALALGMHWV